MQWCCFFCFFFSRPFHENFKFLKNCPYNIHEILHSHFTPKGAPMWAKASISYDCNAKKTLPKLAQKGPKLAQKRLFPPNFWLFSIFSKTVRTIRTKRSAVILHHIRVLSVQKHQNRMAGM